MAKAYYLIDGDFIHGNVLNVPYNGSYARDFQDISILDEATINLGKNIDEQLDETNPKIDLMHNYFNIHYPFRKKEIKPYTTILNKNENTSDLVEKLLPFSEERKYKVLNGEKVQLDTNTSLDKFARYLLHSIFSLSSSERKILTSFESTISKRLKDLIQTRYTEYYNKSFEEFYHVYKNVIMSLFSSYTELRNIILMLQLIKENRKNNNRSLLNAYSGSIIDNIHTETPEQIIAELKEYKKELLIAKAESKEIEFINNMKKNNTYYQYNLSDFFDMSVSGSKKIY